MADNETDITPEASDEPLRETAESGSADSGSLTRLLENTATADSTAAKLGRYLDKTATDPTWFKTRTATDITDFAEGTYTPGELTGDSAAPTTRFELLDTIGKGGTGRVFQMRDNSLKRVIAVKFLQRQNKAGLRDHFVHEAQITAQLEHPNIMPVYDLGLTKKKQVYYTMKKVGGMTVGDAIRRVKHNEAVPDEFRTLDGRVRILLKVCDALAYAHHRGYVHQDVKPDNIMLGDYGEVLVLDWGSAVSVGSDAAAKPRVYGTPAYMAPEQARREAVDERSDVYCLGATMFHMLMLRHPTWAEDAELFWEKKRVGTIDPVAQNERHVVPPRLLRIALKALESDPARRYHSVVALADDLKRYQAGLAVSAYRESPLEAFMRWYRRNQRVFWLAGALVVGVGGAGALLFREKIQEMITWRIFVAEDFSYANSRELGRSWKSLVSWNWYDVREVEFSDSGAWIVRDGALYGRNVQGMDNIAFAREISGNIRVEWTATALFQPRDLNCFIGANRLDGYAFHVGGFGEVSNVTLTKGRNVQRLEIGQMKAPLVVNRPYRFRMEKEDNHIRFYIDGRKIIDYADWDLKSAGIAPTFGFENNQGNRVRIDNVRIYDQPLPLKVSPLAAADRFAERGHWADALTMYNEIVRSYPQKDIAPLAMFRAAECLAGLDSINQAFDAYTRFERDYPRHELAPVSGYSRYRMLIARGDSSAAVQCLRDLGIRFPGHSVLRLAFRERSQRAAVLYRYIDQNWVEDSSVAQEQYPHMLHAEARSVLDWARMLGVPTGPDVFLQNAASTLYGSGRMSFEELVEEFPEQRQAHADALFGRDELERIVQEYSDLYGAAATALMMAGDYRQVIKRFGRDRTRTAEALHRLGRFEAVFEGYSDIIAWYSQALIGKGRIVKAMSVNIGGLEIEARGLGRYDDYVQAVRQQPFAYARALLFELGLPDSALAVLAAIDGMNEIHYYVSTAEALRARGDYKGIISRFAQRSNMENVVTDAFVSQGRPEDAVALYPLVDDIRARKYYELGQFDSIAQFALRAQERRVLGAWYSGRGVAYSSGFTHRPIQRAAALLDQTQFTEVLKQCPDIHEACAKALFGLRRYNDILTHYPHQRAVASEAMYLMGDPVAALERFPETRARYAQYLLESGRARTVVDSFADQRLEYALALVELGEEHRLAQQPWRLGIDRQLPFRTALAIRHFSRGRTADAVSAAPSPDSVNYSLHDQRFENILLRPVLYGLSGDTVRMRSMCRGIMERHGHLMSRTLWHDAAFLAGEISEDQFMAQPVQYFTREWMTLLKAIRADVEGRSTEAARLYSAVARAPQCRYPQMRQMTGVNEKLVTPFHRRGTQLFIAWRVRELDVSKEKKQDAAPDSNSVSAEAVSTHAKNNP